MCNLYRLQKGPEAVRKAFDDLLLALRFPDGIPNFQPREIRITDRAPIVRAVDGDPELVERRWSWPASGGKPVYNYRAEGRDLPRGRCLILADGFYEFTAHSDPKAKRKHKWLFTRGEDELFAIAGLWRNDATIGEAFTMLTCPPGPDVAPYHSRQIVVLPAAQWQSWLDPTVPSRDLLQPLPAGSLTVTQVDQDESESQSALFSIR